MNDWIPDTDDISRFFTRGAEEAYSLTADPNLINPTSAFARWIAEHDRQVAEKAYQAGYSSGWYRGWDDDGDNCCPDNPYRKEQS
ncbi:hypothetical protein [Bifidobacterium callitrichos]|uniref:Uncharacterized protein n=1 Tax=Bifidobacterium callitrichos DSM 23973 TaxID=1437609 RepID=A0A087ACR9_9BIFI|nr:hypothetical protein [Bifidobacterium callitrichos]KFI56569.1 hypothetical protein BCAL_0164 [Bifidobacterium callitrichos DSM 23973]